MGDVDFRNTIFGEGDVIFAEAQFEDGKVSFLHAKFWKGDVDFRNTIFGDGDVDFSYVRFGDGNIIFSKAKFGKGEVLFWKCIIGNGNIQFSNSIFGDGDVIFRGTIFGEGNKSFRNSKFGYGNKDFRFVDFNVGEVHFEFTDFNSGIVDFRNCKFGDVDVYFTVAQFGDGDVFFTNARFGEGRVSFSGAQFGDGDVSFSNARFGDGDVDFINTYFGEGEIYFKKTNFSKSQLSFEKTYFADTYIEFDQTKFNEIVEFEAVDFKGLLKFKHIENVKSLNFVDCSFYNKVDFEDIRCSSIDLSRSAIKDIMNFTGVRIEQFISSQLRITGKLFYDSDVTFIQSAISPYFNSKAKKVHQSKNKHPKRFGFFNPLWYLSRKKRLYPLLKNKSLDQLKDLEKELRDYVDRFQTLKENFHNTGHYDLEDACYVEFRKHELEADKTSNKIHRLEKRNKKNSHRRKKRHLWFRRLAYQWIGQYGTNPKRIALMMIFTIFLFSGVYFGAHQFLPTIKGESQFVQILNSSHLVVPSEDNNQTNTTNAIAAPQEAASPMNTALTAYYRSLYHSFITFLTIGYGDIYPSGGLRIISGIEGLIGLIFISYFTIAFARKVLR